jgi:hypothetical protein
MREDNINVIDIMIKRLKEKENVILDLQQKLTKFVKFLNEFYIMKNMSKCDICIDNPKNMCLSCGHLMCVKCFDKIGAICPFCRCLIDKQKCIRMYFDI